MKLNTKNKNIELRFSTRKIVTICNLLNNKNFEKLYFSIVNENDIDALSKIILTFAELEDGRKAFNNADEVCDFIDDYLAENEKTYLDIFQEIAEAINEEGFFSKKMTKEELTETMSNPLSSMNLNDIVKQSTEKIVTKIAEEEVFQGYKG